MILLIGILAVFFALNMGGASFGASFATTYGGRILSRKTSGLLFVLFVLFGATIYGENVAATLGNDIIPVEGISQRAMVVIFLSAGISMFVANLMNIPQSTSLVTVAAIAGVGLYNHNINVKTILYFVPFWFFLPVVSFVLTYFLAGYVYPPRKSNFWIYEKLVNHQDRLKKFVIICSCYNAFSVGTNNVANVVAPVLYSTPLGVFGLLALFALVYGAGAFVFGGPLKTAGEKIVPLGLLTASIISIVSGSLMIMASGFGVPQSFVMLQMGALFAIAILKNGTELTLRDKTTQKTLFTWTVNPVITLFVSYGLSFLIGQ